MLGCYHEHDVNIVFRETLCCHYVGDARAPFIGCVDFEVLFLKRKILAIRITIGKVKMARKTTEKETCTPNSLCQALFYLFVEFFYSDYKIFIL